MRNPVPVLTRFTDYSVAVSGGRVSNTSSPDGGRTIEVVVATTAAGWEFATTVFVRVGSEAVRGSPASFALTDRAPPQWLDASLPVIAATSPGTITIDVQVDEPATMYADSAPNVHCGGTSLLTLLHAARRFVRIVPSPSAATLSPCDVMSARAPLRYSSSRPCEGAPSVATMEAVFVTSFHVPEGASEVVIGRDGDATLLPMQAYDVWLVAADYSTPPNVQVRAGAATCSSDGIRVVTPRV